MRLYIVALQFLTIIPLPFTVRYDEKSLGRSMALFPLVGLTLGALLVGADYLLFPLFPPRVVTLILIVLMTAVTGALHLDGVADVCDGLAARGDRERFLRVMKDPHIGAVGAVGVALTLLLKYEALCAIPFAHRAEALLVFPMVARFAQVFFTVGSNRARDDGLGSLFIAGVGPFELVIATGLTLGIVLALLGLQGLWVVAIALAVTWGFKFWAHRRLGGITGDLIGCASEINEIVVLLVMVAMLG